MELWVIGGVSAALLLLGSGSTKEANERKGSRYSDGSNWDKPELLHRDWEDAREYTAFNGLTQSRRDDSGKWEFRHFVGGKEVSKAEIDRLYKEKY